MKTSMTIREVADRWRNETETRVADPRRRCETVGQQRQIRCIYKGGAPGKSSSIGRRLRLSPRLHRILLHRPKIMLIKDFLDERPVVSLFPRPVVRENLNMDMLRMFFEKVDEDTSVYFKDKKDLELQPEAPRISGQISRYLHYAEGCQMRSLRGNLRKDCIHSLLRVLLPLL